MFIAELVRVVKTLFMLCWAVQLVTWTPWCLHYHEPTTIMWYDDDSCAVLLHEQMFGVSM